MLVVLAGAVSTMLFAAVYLPLLPTSSGTLGHDYSYFLPQLLAGSYWMHESGALAVPWFTPAVLGGVPFYPNPQNVYHSLPQQLCAITDPLSAVRITFIVFFAVGFSGAYRLLRRAFGVSRVAAVFGAVLFAWNGYYAHRMLIGHIVYHAFMLTPWMAAWLLAPARGGRWREAQRGVLAGVALAYMFQSADLYGLPVAVGTTCALFCAQRLVGRASARTVSRAGVAVLTASSLCAAKLVAMAAFMSAFSRTGYALPGAASIAGALRLATESVFGRAPVGAARGILVNAQWAIDRQELEYGLSPVAALAIIGGVSVLLLRGARPRLLPAGALIGVLLVPIALNVHSSAWEALIKAVPLLGSASNLLRTFSLYILPGAVGAAVVLDRAITSPRTRRTVLPIAAVAVIAWHASADRTYYEEQPYQPGRVVAAWEEMRATDRVPNITRLAFDRDAAGAVTMSVGRNDALTEGVSQLAAFEPIFGYRLEWFPFDGVHEGLALPASRDELNVLQPARFVYPQENGGAPGTTFPASERADAGRFLAYRAIPFEVPLRQRLANVVNVVALFGALGVLLADARVRWTMRS